MVRGKGHRSFVTEIRFDNNYMDEQLKFLKTQKEDPQEEDNLPALKKELSNQSEIEKGAMGKASVS